MTARKDNSNDKASLGREQRNEARVEREHGLVCLHLKICLQASGNDQ